MDGKGSLISIIIPVYNAQQYIERCVKSIQKQTIETWELILVDDGSNDESPRICDRLSSQDHRIRVIHKQNGGVSSARNAGIAESSAEYVVFVDADDWLDPSLCELLLTGAEKSEFILTGYSRVEREKAKVVSSSTNSFEFPCDAANMFESLYGRHLLNAPWAKMYRRDVIGMQRFDTSLQLGEDLLFNLEYLSKCTSVTFVAGNGYNYNCLNENAATKKMRENDIDQISIVYKKTLEFEEVFCKKIKTRNMVNQAFLEAGIGFLQKLYYSDNSYMGKKEIAKDLLSRNEYAKCCKLHFEMQLQYKIIQYLCSHKYYGGLYVFFNIKKNIYKALRGKICNVCN